MSLVNVDQHRPGVLKLHRRENTFELSKESQSMKDWCLLNCLKAVFKCGLSKLITRLRLLWLGDWLKILAPVFRPMISKTETDRTLYARFFPRFEQVIYRQLYYWELWSRFIVLLGLVAIGQSNCFSIGFSIVILKQLYTVFLRHWPFW